ncbi:MAG: hypothetical protein JRD89_01415 [Deltaproteobacteria bacterium]|nr:hypothetical protein [Deltaproteobacteria bacterium]
MLSYVSNHAASGVAFLLQQLKGKAKTTALISAFLVEIQALEDMLWDLLTLRLPDAAVGAQLDVLGRILQVERLGRTDAEYRKWLQAQITVLRSSGTALDVLTVLETLKDVGVSLVLSEEFPAAFNVYMQGTQSAGASIAEIIKKAKLAGVRGLVTWTPAATPFAFDSSTVGFDDSSGLGTTA